MALAVIYTLGSVIVVSLISLIGILTISFSKGFLNKCVSFLVALAIGALLGDAFIHLIPEAFEEIQSFPLASLLVILGYYYT